MGSGNIYTSGNHTPLGLYKNIRTMNDTIYIQYDTPLRHTSPFYHPNTKVHIVRGTTTHGLETDLYSNGEVFRVCHYDLGYKIGYDLTINVQQVYNLKADRFGERIRIAGPTNYTDLIINKQQQ